MEDLISVVQQYTTSIVDENTVINFLTNDDIIEIVHNISEMFDMCVSDLFEDSISEIKTVSDLYECISANII